jgi:acetyltransferase
MSLLNLDKLFSPESVAIVGATEKPESVGEALVKNFLQSGFAGKFFLVNPAHSKVLGRKCYPTVSAIGEPVDLIVVAIPIQHVPEVITDAGKSGVKAAIVISAGGKETGAEGLAIENQILQAAKPFNLRILGPNCLGIIVPTLKLNASFAAQPCLPGRVAMVSQSGAICTVILDRALEANIGFSHFVSIGSMADIDFGDVIDYLGGQSNVDAIIMYMESLTNIRKFMSAARAVSRIKPIIVVKSGRSEAGAKAATSHTGAMLGNDRAYDAAFERAGIIRVNTLADLFDCAEALAKQGRPKGSRLGIITNAGGPGVMAADALATLGYKPAVLSPETMAALNQVLPPQWSHGNPVDILGDATAERYQKAVDILLKAEEIDGLIVILTPQAMTKPAEIASTIAPMLAHGAIPSFAVWMGGPSVKEGIRIFYENSVSVFETPERAIQTFISMYHYTKNLEILYETPPTLPTTLHFDRKRARAIVHNALERDHHLLTETESKALFASYGIAVNRTELATTPEDAVRWAEEIGYPVVLKIHSRDIVHKSDAGAVRLGLKTADAVREAFNEIITSVRRYNPKAEILGITVQQQMSFDYEIILGARKDPQFGPLLLFGMGGIYTEVFQDTAIGMPPLNMLLAKRMVESTKICRLLKGFRNHPPANLGRLFETIVRLAYLVQDFPEITELDINPLLVQGEAIVAADGRVVIEPSSIKSPLHLIISPYPTEYETHWVMKNGTPVLIRPVRPEDEPMLQEFMKNLSSETIYFRFFHQIKYMPHEQLAKLCQVDYDREIALVAVEQPPGRERILGMCHLYTHLGQEEAELAVVIGDPWQREGLGRKLVSIGMDIARQKGIKKIVGVVLPENEGMISLAQKLGFSTIHDLGEGVFRIEREL